MDPQQGSDIPHGKVIRPRKSLYVSSRLRAASTMRLTNGSRSKGSSPPELTPAYTSGGARATSSSSRSTSMTSSSRPTPVRLSTHSRRNSTPNYSDPVSFFHGFNVHRDRENQKLFISQEHYLEILLDQFGMTDCKPAHITLPSGFRPVKATDGEFEKPVTSNTPKSSDPSSTPLPSLVQTSHNQRRSYHVTSASGTNHTTRLPNICYGTFGVHPTSALPSTAIAGSASSRNTQTQTGEATWVPAGPRRAIYGRHGGE